MTKETLKDIINKDLSPDKVKDMSFDQLKDYLLVNNIVKTPQDINLIIIEKIQDVYKKDDEFPIHYYTSETEEIPDANRVVEDDSESLTDDFIESHLS